MERVKQLIDGKLVNYQVACITQAFRTFAERAGTDQNPNIVQMLALGIPIEHWYYRSEDWIDQPYHHPERLFAYVGSTSGNFPPQLGPGTFKIDTESTRDIKSALQMADQGDKEYLDALLE